MPKASSVRTALARWRLKERLLRHGAWPLAAAWALLLCILVSTPLWTYIDINVSQPLHFRARELLRRDPPLHPKLKMFAFDDGSVDRLQRADLTIDDWATVLTGMAAKKPRAIYIDKVFSIIFDPLNRREEALRQIKTLQVPIIVGSFAVERENKTRHELNLENPRYRLSAMLASLSEPPPDFDQYRGWRIYGPHPDLQSVFQAGHILYPGRGMVSAFMQPTPDIVLPHATMLLEERRFERGNFLVNGTLVPLDRTGQMPVNFSREDAFYERQKRLSSAVLAARKGEPVKWIEEGDTVLILPEMYTGSTDFKSTPIGILPGGFVLASLLNSVLTSSWVGFAPLPELQLLVFCIIGAFCGYYRKSWHFWLGQAVVLAAASAVGVLLFAFQSILLPTPMHLVAFWGSSLIVFADRTLKREREASRIAEELSEAAAMARAFLPDQAPSWDGFEIAAYHKSYTEASGDWYAFCRSPSGRYHHFILADVTGHGVQAALMVSIAKTILAVYTLDHPDKLESADFLKSYARDLNAMLYHHGKGQHLLTLLGTTFDLEKGELHLISAGHPPPLLIKEKAGQERKQTRQVVLRSTVLGLDLTYEPRSVTEKFQAGDEFVAYTDGLPIGHHVRALNRFMSAPRSNLAVAPETLLRDIWVAETQKTGRTLDDDVSIVWFRHKGSKSDVSTPSSIRNVAS